MSNALMDDLRARFRETSRVRLEEMDASLAALDRDVNDATALRRLAKHFHAFAGMGGTYGYPRVSELGDEAEATLLPLVRQGAASPQSVARCGEMLREIRDILRTEAKPATLPPMHPSPVPFDVLVVGDLAVVRALEEEGASVRVCSTQAEALREIASRVPDALIVDLQLPDGSGYEVVEALRATDDGHSAGAIVVSSETDFIDKLRAIRTGADAFEGKPLDLHAIVRRMLSFRDRKRRPPQRVLAVEDDPTQAFLIRSILGAAGYEVSICADPARFEEELTRFAPDLLMLDIHLENDDVSGYELAKYVRQNERFATLPVIFVSGDSERAAIINATLSGADLHISKPVDWSLLLSHVAARLERSNTLRDLAERDALTGLLTRSAFEGRARRRLEQHRRAQESPAMLVLLDIDHFKEINDAFGHAVGDRVLAALGAMLRRRLRQSDLVGRFGGEEFTLLLDGVSMDAAVHLTERLLAEFSELDAGQRAGTKFSEGIAPLEISLEATMSRADAALYAAKRAGRSRVVSA